MIALIEVVDIPAGATCLTGFGGYCRFEKNGTCDLTGDKLATNQFKEYIRCYGCISGPGSAQSAEQKNKYSREIKPGVFVDVYDVLRAFKVHCPAIAHAIKKLLAAGNRGHKDARTDLNEAIQSITRATEMHEEVFTK
jgi:hypothetical protein